MERYKNDVIDLGHVFEGTESGLVVPRYMVEAGVRTISDLLKPEAKQRLRQTITGIDAGAGVMVTTENEVMPAYGLTDAGYTLLPSSGPAMMAALKQAMAKKEWIVVTGWKPHSMFGYWDLAFLEQDKDKVWGVGNIHIMGRKTLREDLSCEIECSLDTADTGADDHCRMFNMHRFWEEVFKERCLGNCHSDSIFCFIGCSFAIVHVDPRVLFADVCHLEPERVQSPLFRCGTERRFVQTG